MADQKRIIRGWASVEARDGEGELIPMDILRKTMEGVKEREMPVTLQHADSEEFDIVGKLIDYEFKFNDEKGEDGLWVVCEIFQDHNNPTYDQVWNNIEPNLHGEDSEKLSQFSLGGKYKLDGNGTAEWIAPTTLAITQKGMNEGADIVEKEGDSMPEEKDPKPDPEKKDPEMNKADEQPKTPIEKPAAEGEKPKQDPEIFDAKKAYEDMKKAYDDHMKTHEETNGRVQKIEDMLDKLASEEDKEHSTDAEIEKKEEGKEGAAKAAEPEPKKDEEKETLAQHSKKLAALEAENKELKMKMSKYENAGIRRTVQSGSSQAPPESDGVTDALKNMGAID